MNSSAVEKSADDLRGYLSAARTGRKRKAPVTLATVAFSEGYSFPSRALDDGDLSENPHTDYERYFRERGAAAIAEPAGKPVPSIDDSTLSRGAPLADEENAAQLADIFVESFDSLAAAQQSKINIRKQADPMGLKTGVYAKRPRSGVGDATLERLKKATQAEKDLVTEEETFEDGRSTGLSRKRFRGILEVWRHKGTIDDATFDAAEAFQRDCDLSLSASPRMIARYGHRLPAGVPDLLPQEIQIEFEARKRAAIAAVDNRLHFILAWIAEVSNAEVHPDTVAERYWRHLSKDRRMERFKALLEYTCMLLSVHYGQVDEKRHRWVRMAISKAAAEVYDLLNA